MENWGCMTFIPSILFPKEDLYYDVLYRAARVICHEISHIWFGNLVTPKCWDYTWLSEGFARYMESVALAEIRPKYKVCELFCLSIKKEILEYDNSSKTHPIEFACTDTKAMMAIFDQITYSKGACIIKMLNNYVGEEQFREAINIYLKTYSYGNVVPNDLWKIFNDVTKKPIGTIMETWFNSSGYFLLTK